MNQARRFYRDMAKNFKDLSEAEILALAISNEETDGRIYADFAVTTLRVVQENLGDAVALGFGKENASALIKALEKRAGVEVKAKP